MRLPDVRWTTLLLTLSLFGCLQEAVSPEELTGRWSIANEVRQRLPLPLQHDSSVLILKTDRTFEARAVPAVMWGQGSNVISGRGNWSFNERTQTITLTLLKIGEGDEKRVPYGTDLSVFRTQRGVGLRSFDGDPDDWQTIEFEKTEVTQSRTKRPAR